MGIPPNLLTVNEVFAGYFPRAKPRPRGLGPAAKSMRGRGLIRPGNQEPVVGPRASRVPATPSKIAGLALLVHAFTPKLGFARDVHSEVAEDAFINSPKNRRGVHIAAAQRLQLCESPVRVLIGIR